MTKKIPIQTDPDIETQVKKAKLEKVRAIKGTIAYWIMVMAEFAEENPEQFLEFEKSLNYKLKKQHENETISKD